MSDYYMGVSMEKVYEELKELRKEVSVIGYALIPEEEVSDGELEEIISIAEEMEKGES
ncbi:MAG: hypothetical protein ACXQTD_02640 [Candidatus Syntropharchaeia archaeon]